MTLLIEIPLHVAIVKKWEQFISGGSRNISSKLSFKTHSEFRRDDLQQTRYRVTQVSYTFTCTERRRKGKDHCFRQKNKHFFPLVSCLWICTALEKCINHFYTWNCLRKLEILVQRNQFIERMPICHCYELL